MKKDELGEILRSHSYNSKINELENLGYQIDSVSYKINGKSASVDIGLIKRC